HRLEAAAAERAQRAGCIRMPQHALGRKHDQRLAPAPQRLSSQKMEVLSRGRRLADLDVVLGGKLQVALDTRAGMLGALAFIAMRKEHHQAGEQPPLVFAGDDELVDDDLGSVREIAELGFPEREAVRIVAAESVLEAQHSSL